MQPVYGTLRVDIVRPQYTMQHGRYINGGKTAMILRLSSLRVLALLVIAAILLTACGADATPTVVQPTATAASASTESTPTSAGSTAPTATTAGQLAGGTISVGAVVPTTGKYAAGGTLVKNGYELAVEDINSAGGVDVNGTKMKLELTVLDDESDPTKTTQRMETLNSSNHVVAYLGGYGSDLHAAASAIAEKNKIPYVGIAFALKKIHEQGYQYLFSPFPKSPDIAKATFDLLDTFSPKPTKVAIFAETTDWGGELGALWRTEIKNRGYELTVDEQYAPGAKDFSPLVSKAKDSGAQVVLGLPSPPDGTAIVKQLKELAYTPQAMFLIRAPDSTTWAKNLGKDGDDVMLIQGWDSNVHFAGSADMVKRYEAKYNAPAQSSVGAAYACVQILVDAISRARSTDPKAIRDALASTNLSNTVIGPVKFNSDGTGQVTTIVTQYQNGKQVSVWPKEQAAASAIFPAPAFDKR
jgi:branched-chain amino acid transport system substrate-binding protein